MVKDLLIFDMDGVLVEVSESYRETIQQTVEHFTGSRPERQTIQDWKNQGGWNDDWKLSHALIKEGGVPKSNITTVVDHFQKLFHGDGTDGLMLRERWIADDGLFDRLTETMNCAVFTGRLRWEAELTLKRFQHEICLRPSSARMMSAKASPTPRASSKFAQWYPTIASGTSETPSTTREPPKLPKSPSSESPPKTRNSGPS